eukprot:31020-Pelagococcus_subviridis.AAC.5
MKGVAARGRAGRNSRGRSDARRGDARGAIAPLVRRASRRARRGPRRARSSGRGVDGYLLSFFRHATPVHRVLHQLWVPRRFRHAAREHQGGEDEEAVKRVEDERHDGGSASRSRACAGME